MDASCTKKRSLDPSVINAQILDLFAGQSPTNIIFEKDYLELKSEVGYWKSMHAKAVKREQSLKDKIKVLQGQIRDLRQRVFSKQHEKPGTKKGEGNSTSSNPKRPRGQQPGSEGHGLTDRPDLLETHESVEFTEEPVCPECGKPYIPDGTCESETIEVEVKAYKRIIRRPCMKQGCTCSGVPASITAPMPPKVIPKSPYGNSIWEAVLLTKFLYCQPTNRLLNQYAELGLPISPGTVTGGLKTLMSLFNPVCDAFNQQQMTENRFHNDESSWKVFEHVEGKIGNKWWLWVSRSESVVFFQITPGRGSDVPVEYFGNTQRDKIIVICDRFSAYKALAKQLPYIILAFCWAHVRRDYLDAARKYPELQDWAFFWVDMIATLYHINNRRRKEFDPELSLQQQTPSFNKLHIQLVEKMNEMVKKRDASIKKYDPAGPNATLLSTVKHKIMTSLENHWDGLSVFVTHPEVPMDNNAGENSIRNPVTGRKNFYGSGSVWSSRMAAMMFTIFQTLALWKINRNHWLRSYLAACGENHGRAPENLSFFLPWEMSEERRLLLARPPDTS
jgi:transposase